MAQDFSEDYAAALESDSRDRLRSEYEALAFSDDAEATGDPQIDAATVAEPGQQVVPAGQGVAAAIGRNLREIPRQFVFGIGQGISEAASKVGLSDGAQVGDEPTTFAGGMSRAAGQFLPGFMATSAAIAALPESLAGAGLVAAAAKAKALVSGAVAGTLDFDQHEPRVSNLINEIGLSNPLTEYLAADPSDSNAEALFKSAVENLGLGAATDGLVALARMNKARIVANRAIEKAAKETPELAMDEALAASRDVLDPAIDMKVAAAGDPAAPLLQTRMADAEARAATSGGEVALADAVPQSPQRVYLNLARIETPDDVKAAIDTLASQDADAINAARGGERQTFDEVKSLADSLGLKPEEVINRTRGPMGAAEAVAARKLMTSSGEQLTALAKRAASAEATPADFAAFQKATAVHYALQTEVIAARTETARALASWRIPATAGDLRLSDVQAALSAAGGPENVRRIAQKLAVLSDPAAQAAAVRNGFKTGFKGAWDQLWFGSLLSSPKTLLANAVDGALTAGAAIPERLGAAAFDNVAGAGDISMHEATSMLWGAMRGAREGFTAAGKAIRTGEGSDLFSKLEVKGPRGVRPEIFGVGPDSALGHAINAIGFGLDIPGRVLLGTDEFFKSVNFRMELNAQAYRQAISEGLTGNAASERMAEIVANPPDSLVAQAADFGRTQTYTNKLGPVASKIAELRDVTPGMKYIAPFVRTPANIMRYSFERTPLAPLSAAVRADIAAGGPRASQAYARIGMGTMAMMAVADMVAHGQITGGGPEEPSLRAARERLGIPQYSIKVGDQWVSYQRLGYFGTIMGLAADAAEMQGLAGFEDADRTVAGVGLLFAKSLANKSYLQGVFKAASIASDPNSDRPAADFLKQLAASFVPFSGIINSAARAVDPVARETRTAAGDPELGDQDSATAVFMREFVNKLRSRTPGLSAELPPVRDLWGRPKTYTSNLGIAYDFTSPFQVTSETKDAVDQAILDNGITLQMPERSIQDVPLTGEEYQRYVELAGVPAKHALDAIVSTPQFKSWTDGPDGLKALKVKQIVDEYRSAARAMLIRERPELLARIQAQQVLKHQLLTVPELSQ